MPSNNKPAYSLYTNGMKYEDADLSVDFLSNYLNQLTSKSWDFMTLEPNEPVKGSVFFQVGAPDAEIDYKMTVEISIFNSDRVEIYRYYTKDKGEILQMIVDYYEKQEIPNYNTWEDVSNEMNR